MSDRLLTVGDVAEKMNLKEATVRAKVLKREWTYIKVGRSIRFRESFINSLIDDGEVPAREQRAS